MTDAQQPLKVAIIGTNNDSMYSGGRYHALIVAYALARAGHQVTFITNKKPLFFDDLEPLAPEQIKYVYTGDFRANMPHAALDFVILIPTGIFHPEFYEAVLAFTRTSRARLALVNFESGNWFNATSPVPRDLRLWEYWRRSVADGGLVISSLRISDTHARDFYRANDPDGLRFEVCGPPINSPAADLSQAIDKDGSVITFVRSSDPHKGGHDLLELPPQLLKGRTLKIIAGGSIDPEFRTALEERYTPGGTVLEFHTAISDARKFELIAQAQALLFPSRFEGFGYPPVEAAYCGTETVCYDLPVLQETVGAVAHMASVGDVAAFGAALETALERPERRAELKEHVSGLVGIDAVGLRLTDILLRSIDPVRQLQPLPGAGTWGPFQGENADASVRVVPPMPCLLHSYCETALGKSVLAFQICSRHRAEHVNIELPGISVGDMSICHRDIIDGCWIVDVTAHLTGEVSGTEPARITAHDAAGTQLCRETLLLKATAAPAVPALSMTGLWAGPSGSRITFRRSGCGDRIRVSGDNGQSWSEGAFIGDTATVELPAEAPHVTGLRVYVYEGHAAIGHYAGCPPLPDLPDVAEDALPVGCLNITPLNDAHWLNGVLRKPGGKEAGVIVCELRDDLAPPTAGDVVQLGSGRILRVLSVERKGRRINVNFAVPVEPQLEGAPHYLKIVARAAGLVVPRAPQDRWFQGVWRGDGDLSGRCVNLPVESMVGLGGRPPALLNSENREIGIDALWPGENGWFAWLSSPVDDVSRCNVVIAAAGLGLSLLQQDEAPKAAPDGAWPDAHREGRVVALVPEAEVMPGDVLVFDNSRIRHVEAVERHKRSCDVLLDSRLQADEVHSIRFATMNERSNFDRLHLRFPSRVTSPGVTKLMGIADEFRASLPPLPAVPTTDRPRVLFASLVPPDPADQGNRIVTRNFVMHLVAQGFNVDLLLVGRVAPERMALEFGDRVRVFSWPFPNWAAEPSAALRQKLIEQLRHLNPAPFEAETFETLLRTAATYHPFYIVPDGLIRIAKALYRTHDYHSIVCNYTHMIRVAAELSEIRPLPPVTVVTHDALSRLPLEFAGKPLDTMYRMCAPETERAVLDAVPGAVILAISKSEQAYFREIGVSNLIELCEYDGLRECSQYSVPDDGFDRRQLVFHASGNPMNRVAIDWFLQHCWSRVRAAVPQARLVICGSICKHIDNSIPGVEPQGVVSRSRLMEILGSSSVAINPTLAGTGLKIKTVEAACIGLPSVCMPPAIEGLEEVADRFCLLETEPEPFAMACIRLLNDRTFWSTLNRSSLDLSVERFSEEAIYGPIDRHMGWDKGVEDRLATPAPDYAIDDLPQFYDLSETLPDEVRTRCRLVADLESLGETETAYRLFLDVVGTKHPEILVQATRLAAAKNEEQSALRHGCEVHANRPADTAILATLARTLAQAGQKSVAADIWHQIALAAPVSPSTYALAQEMKLDDGTAAAGYWTQFPINLPLNTRQYLKTSIPVGQHVGLGWSPMESWGIWSNGRFARLALTFPPTPAALKIIFLGHVKVGNLTEDRIVQVRAEGEFHGRIAITPDESVDFLKLSLPATVTPRDAVGIEFTIENPMPLRDTDGKLRDARQMGIALQAITLRESDGPLESP